MRNKIENLAKFWPIIRREYETNLFSNCNHHDYIIIFEKEIVDQSFFHQLTFFLNLKSWNQLIDFEKSFEKLFITGSPSVKLFSRVGRD